MRLLLVVLTAATANRVEHVSPELSEPPPANVTDINGKSVRLPFATTWDDAASCAEAFASGAHAGSVGNRQNPYSSHGEDMAALRRFGPLEPRSAWWPPPPSAWSDGHRRVFLEIGAFDGVTESTLMREPTSSTAKRRSCMAASSMTTWPYVLFSCACA